MKEMNISGFRRFRMRWFSLIVGLCFAWGTTSCQGFTVGSFGTSAYVIDGTNNATLTLQRGVLYVFSISAPGHPFYIKTVPNDTGTGNQYNTGVTNNGTSSGTLFFDVATNAPNTLYYHCSIHPGMGGDLNIVDPPSPPTVRIVHISVSGSVVIQSTGTNGWNAIPEYNCDLSGTNWATVPSFTNAFANGTNTTTFGPLDGICGSPSVAVRIRNEQE